MVIALIFLVRAAANILVLMDLGTEIVTRWLGVREEKSMRRVAKDLVYMLLAILLAAAVSPITASLPQVGGPLTTAISLLALGIFLILTYDIGRVLYRILERKAEAFADWLAELARRMAERGEGEKRANS